ncbi:hypothetical protein PMAYCL1PPCAC_00495, partial [Pristionchus mayeri]
RMSSPAKKKIKGDFDSLSPANSTDTALEVNRRLEQDVDLSPNARNESSEKTAAQLGESNQQVEKKDVTLAEKINKHEVPFLRLPNELLFNLLKLLPPKDRLKARVNKRLNGVEETNK